MLTEAVFDRSAWWRISARLFPETAARFLAVNGVREPTITMRPGEVQRWRILHAGWQDDMFLDLEGHTLNAIARDGIPLARMGQSVPRKPDQPTDYPKAMLMAPGQRHRRFGAGGRARNLCVARRPLRSGLSLPDRPHRPPRGGRRSAAR